MMKIGTNKLSTMGIPYFISVSLLSLYGIVLAQGCNEDATNQGASQFEQKDDKDAGYVDTSSFTYVDDDDPDTVDIEIDDPDVGGDPPLSGCAANPTPFISFWEVTSDGGTVRLPIAPDEGDGEFDFTVDWNDGTEKQRIWSGGTRSAARKYDTAGQVAVWIEGHIGSVWNAKVSTEKSVNAHLIAVEDLGSVGWESLQGAFYSQKTSYSKLEAVEGGCTDEVTDMSYMFYNVAKATPYTSGWDTSQVTDMKYMFYDASKADPDVSNWDFSSIAPVEGVDHMLYQTSSISVENYSTLLMRMADLDEEGYGLAIDVLQATLNVEHVKYTAEAAEARAHLITRQFKITDGGLFEEEEEE